MLQVSRKTKVHRTLPANERPWMAGWKRLVMNSESLTSHMSIELWIPGSSLGMTAEKIAGCAGGILR